MPRIKRTGRAPFPPDGPAMSDVLFALSCETRLEIIQLLAYGELDVTSIANRLELALNNISQHLRILWKSGILDIECRGVCRIYRISERLRTSMKRDGIILRVPCCEQAAVTIRSRRNPHIGAALAMAS